MTHDEIHHVTACASVILEEGLEVMETDRCVPRMTELEEAHTVPEAEVRASAAFVAHSLEDIFQADWHQRSYVDVAALRLCNIKMRSRSQG